MISTIRKATNDYYEASDSVLQIGHLFGSNGVTMTISRKELQRFALLVSTIRVAENGDSEACNSIF